MTQITVRQDDLAILVIDVQPFFLDGWMDGVSEPLLARLEFLLGIAAVYQVPVAFTFEQPVEKKGWLPERLEPFAPAGALRLTKNSFNCCGEPEIVDDLAALGKRQFAVAGGETDVCVLQSVLGLLGASYEVFLLEDALFSSEPNVGPAIRRMEQAGAIPSTVKTLNYELRRSVARTPTE
jgi:nicotinamidase-related amidase